MRGILIAIVIVVVLIFVGWLRFSTPEGNPTIQVDKEKIKQDTAVVVEKAKGVVDEVDRRVDVDIDTSADPDPAAETP